MLGKILYWLQGNKLLREPKKMKQDIVMIEVIKKENNRYRQPLQSRTLASALPLCGYYF